MAKNIQFRGNKNEICPQGKCLCLPYRYKKAVELIRPTALKKCLISLCFFRLSVRQEQAHQQQHRKDDRRQDADVQVILKRTGHQPGECGTAGAAHIPCQCQHGKHRRAAAFDGSRCFAERSRPEDSHRKAADRTAEQSHKRHGNKDDTQIRCHAQHTAVLHKTVQVQPIAELAVDQSCRSHQQGERHRTGEVAHGFGDAQTLLCKRRCPLAHCLLRCAGTEHHQQKDPKNLPPEQCPQRQPFFALFVERIQRNSCKENRIANRDQYPQQGENLPVFHAKQGEKRRRQQYHAHMSPAVKRMQQAHRLFLVFCGTRLQNRADEDFDQTAADGIDYDRQHDAGIGVRQQIREECPVCGTASRFWV